MAAALAVHRVGFETVILERYPEVKAAGNILNLWPPPQKVLQLLGVDIHDLGAPVHSVFANHRGRIRADVRLPDEVVREYGGGFIGLLRPGLYQRMMDALPQGILRMNHRVTGFDDDGRHVSIHVDGHQDVEADVLIGADGINSMVRETLWGQEPIREQNLHLVGGYVLLDGDQPAEGVIAHDRDTQGSYTAIRHDGRGGYEWWVLRAWPHDKPFTEDLATYAKMLAAPFGEPLVSIIDKTPAENLQRWPIRDRKPLKQWGKGRVTLLGDAAHPTSPYAAYGAGMSIEDGYFLARELAAVDIADTDQVRAALQAYEDRRKPHTAKMSELAYRNGRMFHHLPRPLQPLRDLVFDHTPFLQKVIGEQMPNDIVSQLAEIEDPQPASEVGVAG
jgi:2-polyprenyl-6-methoxyphenol hydroxylase-like FAD-dependent oxidoreductase